MLRPCVRCLLVLFVVFGLLLSAYGILLGRLRQNEEPASNVVPGSGVRFPASEDIDCKTDHGYPGQCVDIRRCHAARRAVGARSHPVRCGWINHYIPRVCCHPDQVMHSKMVFRPSSNRRRNERIMVTSIPKFS